MDFFEGLDASWASSDPPPPPRLESNLSIKKVKIGAGREEKVTEHSIPVPTLLPIFFSDADRFINDAEQKRRISNK